MPSVAIGNCGFGFAPVRAAEREQAMLTLTRVEAIPLESMRNELGSTVNLGVVSCASRELTLPFDDGASGKLGFR